MLDTHAQQASMPGLKQINRREVIQLKKEVIAYRKACTASGTGLSHYIMLGKKAK